jgi:hypothetical protein
LALGLNKVFKPNLIALLNQTTEDHFTHETESP